MVSGAFDNPIRSAVRSGQVPATALG